jgi:signal-transduction protein with cAMP-binding, CBS, and nucleotidyltransferase domain
MVEEILVKEVKTTKVVHLDKNKTIYDAACVMKQNNISSIVVLDKNAICGIVTERDVTQKVVAGGLNPLETTLSQVMSSPVKTIDSGQTIVDAARMMRDLKVKKLIVTEGRNVVGIISERDILEMDPALHSPKTD